MRALVVPLLAMLVLSMTSPPMDTMPPPPVKLMQGCPHELLYSKSFRQLGVMCRAQPSVAVAAHEGVLDAMQQCRTKMRLRQWDCSTPHAMLDPPLLKYGYRESAVVWAMSAAGAAWGVAAACSQGWLQECACTTKSSTSWEWGGCSIGVQFGTTASRKLLQRTSGGRQGLRRLEKHNQKAGRLAVKKTLVSSCRCHGVSGSCQQKTCWKRVADLPTITASILEKYHTAKLVRDEETARPGELIFSDVTPDHCKDGSLGWEEGAVRPRRECGWRNETHAQGDCDRLCCGRGYTTKHEVVSYKCDCKFVWCCDLVCNDCLKHRWVSVCQ